MPLLVAILAGCSPTIANRGNLLDADRIAQIKADTSTREDVIDKLGSPSHRSTFDDNTWYYIGRRTERYSFLDPEVTDQQIITIHFDDNGIVKTIEKTGKDEIANIDAAPGQTPSFGRDTSWIQDLFGNIGRAGTPMAGQSRRGRPE
ncbi:MAG: outer membrane protein assembly factor BamE [Alphaproteobacteria bacterium]